MTKFVFDYNLPKNIPLFFKQTVKNAGSMIAQLAKDKLGKFQSFTYSDVYEKIIAFALSLRNIGLKRGENVAIISDNRKEWLVSDIAIQSIGGVDVPRGCDSMANEIRYIISFADCKIGIFENINQLKKVLENYKEVPLLKKAILYEMPTETEYESIKEAIEAAEIELLSYDSLMAAGFDIYSKDKINLKNEIEAEMEKTDGKDLATIIFTSGTTGTPKGVMLTHENYISQFSGVQNFIIGKPGEVWMSILPIWHSFERLAMYVSIYYKMAYAYSKPVARVLLADMAELNPYCLCGVPRVWESVASGVYKTMQKTGGATFALYKFFMAAGKKFVTLKCKVTGNICRESKISKTGAFFKAIIPFLGLAPIYGLGKILVYNKIKGKFGKKFTFAVSGGGSLSQEVDDFYRTIGISMLNGYGMTETAPAIAFRDCRKPQYGVVGKVFPTLEYKIVKEDHGEILSSEPLGYGQKGLILLRGTNVMKGYYNRPDLTEKIIDKDGWLNTGDVGLITYDDDLKITGRAKDTIVLLGGENVEPVGIENAICSSQFVESAIVFGQDKKYLATLIVPIKEAIINYAQQNHILFDTYEALLKLEKIKNLISNEINSKVSSETGFKICERISKFTLIPDSFKVGTELSAKQEMIRHKIYEKYKALVEKMFA